MQQSLLLCSNEQATNIPPSPNLPENFAVRRPAEPFIIKQSSANNQDTVHPVKYETPSNTRESRRPMTTLIGKTASFKQDIHTNIPLKLNFRLPKTVQIQETKRHPHSSMGTHYWHLRSCSVVVFLSLADDTERISNADRAPWRYLYQGCSTGYKASAGHRSNDIVREHAGRQVRYYTSIFLLVTAVVERLWRQQCSQRL